MITKLDEALSICVVLGTLTTKQASNISALCEHEIKKYRELGLDDKDFVLNLAAVMDTPGTIFVSHSDILELITPNPEKETLQ